jgi:hypothetical protein
VAAFFAFGQLAAVLAGSKADVANSPQRLVRPLFPVQNVASELIPCGNLRVIEISLMISRETKTLHQANGSEI